MINDYLQFPSTRLGLSLSGGADSAVLAYALAASIKTPIHFFTLASREKQNRSVFNSVNVLSKCKELTGHTELHHHIKYADHQTRDSLLGYLLLSVRQGMVDFIITATTSTPSKEVLHLFPEMDEGLLSRRDPTKQKPTWNANSKLYHPFVNIDKKQIFEFYKELNILGTIFPLTCSCENLSQEHGHCGVCWWCKERAWAFDA